MGCQCQDRRDLGAGVGREVEIDVEGDDGEARLDCSVHQPGQVLDGIGEAVEPGDDDAVGRPVRAALKCRV